MSAGTTSGLFVTGTDTGVGKTHVATALIGALTAAGRRVRARKPVESGCREGPGGLEAADALALHQAAGAWEAATRVCPLRYAHALAPDRAARLAGQRLSLARLRAACLDGASAGDGTITVVEGAGGFLSPLAEDGLNADLAVALGYPVLLVVADRLGCLNHALLTAEAVASRGLRLAAVALNALPGETGPEGMDNLADLARRLAGTAPVVRAGDLEALSRRVLSC